MEQPSLRKSYGEVIIPKGTKLYHSHDDNTFFINNNKEILFTTFDPHDWPKKYITVIILKRDISVLFMVKSINFHDIEPLIHILVDNGKSDDVRLKQCLNTFFQTDN